MQLFYKESEECCAELATIAQNIQGIMENINEIGTKLVSSGSWTGSASNHYVKKLTACTANYQGIYDNIQTSVQFFLNEIQEFKDIERDIMVTGLFGAIPGKEFR